MGRRKRRSLQIVEGIDGPAKLVPGQVIELETVSPKLGGGRRYRNFSHPLDLALHKQKINDGQWAAGDEYRRKYLLRERSGVDSTQGSSGGSSGTPWTQVQMDAIRWLKRTDAAMSANDVAIIRHFCGEGHSMVDSLRAAGVPHHPNGVLPRMWEALDNLGRTIGSGRKKSA